MEEFYRISRLPPYTFNIVRDLLIEARRKGEDIIDLGMGNPDLETPKAIVAKLVEAAKKPRNHRYSVSRGIYKLRVAISDWYKRRYNVDIDPETEAVVTMGAKEGIGHLVLATINAGDVVFVPEPTYPIHTYSVVIAGGDLRTLPLLPIDGFIERLSWAIKTTWPQPKMLILSFPNNPTTEVVDIDFFEKIVAFAKEHNIMVIHDLAYADLVFDEYKAPSFLQVKGAKEVGVEFFSLSKSYSMPGWRVGFAVGNRRMILALSKIKSYLDYGVFQPIQIASITALKTDDQVVHEIAEKYRRRRNTLISGLNPAGWQVPLPKATMFVWAKIPDPFDSMGSLDFCKKLLQEAKVAASPGIGFGECGEGYVRFALVENEHRIRQAVKGIEDAHAQFAKEMIGVGIIGLGTVGRGTYNILKQYGPLIERKTGIDVRVVKVAETDRARSKGIEDDGVALVSDARELINDPRVEICVELIGGTGMAYDYVAGALKAGKWVVTANKALLAEKGDALFAIAGSSGSEIGFEASVAGAIPVIRAIRDGLIGNRIEYILGILNGTSNYILSKMSDEGVPFSRALREAQELGFAEQDPTLDISGVDAAHKLCVLVRLAFGVAITMGQIVTRGVSSIEPIDIEFAKEFGYKIKLLAIAKEQNDSIEARVEPTMIPVHHPMSTVNGVFNAVYVVGDHAGPSLYYGKGAGAGPTGSAVVSDIVDMAVRKAAGCARKGLALGETGKRIKQGEEAVTPFYMRVKAQDQPGVLSRISGILGEHRISIAAVIQKGRTEKDYVPIVMLTYEAPEGNLKQAKEKIDGLPFIGGPSVYMRIEEGDL